MSPTNTGTPRVQDSIMSQDQFGRKKVQESRVRTLSAEEISETSQDQFSSIEVIPVSPSPTDPFNTSIAPTQAVPTPTISWNLHETTPQWNLQLYSSTLTIILNRQ